MIRRLGKAVAASAVGWPVTARVARGKGITVLMYHRIEGAGEAFSGPGRERFREQMRWVRRRCAPIAPEEFRPVLEGRQRTARPAVLVTFDDGYRDFHDHAYPVLQELRIPAVVFLATGVVDRGGLIWTDSVGWAVHHSRRPIVKLPWNGSSRVLSSSSERDACAGVCKAFLKSVPDAERTRWLAELFAALDVDPKDGSAGRQMLNWDEVRATMEYARFGGHTHTHPILSQVGAREAEEEIRLCRDRIRDETGQVPRYFAYPNGRAQDFSEETKGILRRCGFELAFSTIEGIHQRGMDCYAIRRQPTGGRTIGDFAWLVAGH
jgi:peptidoglycan/xylan/chitin deacetylase (PgdA/CDA1 family)